MNVEVWRHVPSLGPFPWEPGVDYTVEEPEPGLFCYRYRRCECLRFQPDPCFYRPETRAQR